MRKYLLFVLALPVLLLVGCINRGGPSYIESVDVYVNGVLIEGYTQYYDKTKNKWFDYNDKTKDKVEVYYTFDLSLEDNIEIVFNFYNMNLIIKEVKIVYINDSHSSETAFVTPEEKEDRHTKVIVNIEDYDESFNVIKVPSWLTDYGLKYQRKTRPDGSYGIWGVHLNIN